MGMKLTDVIGRSFGTYKVLDLVELHDTLDKSRFLVSCKKCGHEKVRALATFRYGHRTRCLKCSPSPARRKQNNSSVAKHPNKRYNKDLYWICNQKYKEKKKRAESRSKPFELTLDEFISVFYERATIKITFFGLIGTIELPTVSKPCFYCGMSSSGLDRVDSSMGYVVNNVVVCCARCNLMKFTMSTDEWLSHMRLIIERMC